jgi:Envelope integrity protein A
MQALMRTVSLVIALVGLGTGSVEAQAGPPPPPPPPGSPAPQSAQTEQYSSNEVIEAGHRFFGTISRGLAEIVEKAGSQWGLPNGYILGQEAGGAWVAGLRYGEGILYTKNAGDLRVYWQGPSLVSISAATAHAP